MTDGSVERDATADERAWREAVERRVSVEDDCTQRAGELAASRRAFDASETAGSTRVRWVVRGLVLLAIPLIVYSELVTPSGAINYSGMGIGVVLMLAGGLAYL